MMSLPILFTACLDHYCFMLASPNWRGPSVPHLITGSPDEAQIFIYRRRFLHRKIAHENIIRKILRITWKLANQESSLCILEAFHSFSVCCDVEENSLNGNSEIRNQASKRRNIIASNPENVISCLQSNTYSRYHQCSRREAASNAAFVWEAMGKFFKLHTWAARSRRKYKPLTST